MHVQTFFCKRKEQLFNEAYHEGFDSNSTKLQLVFNFLDFCERLSNANLAEAY